MAYRFTVNSAIRAPLLWQSGLLQPPPQGAISFRTVYGLRRPNTNQPRFPLILSSRFYSVSTPSYPLLKGLESTESSQSSVHRFVPKAKKLIGKYLKYLKAWAGVLFTDGNSRCRLRFYVFLKYADYQRVSSDMSPRDSASQIRTKNFKYMYMKLDVTLRSIISRKRDRVSEKYRKYCPTRGTCQWNQETHHTDGNTSALSPYYRRTRNWKDKSDSARCGRYGGAQGSNIPRCPDGGWAT